MPGPSWGANEVGSGLTIMLPVWTSPCRSASVEARNFCLSAAMACLSSTSFHNASTAPCICGLRKPLLGASYSGSVKITWQQQPE
eukprot:scaffold78138_cov36-Prasinocladus_malaysianus.AAC.1